MNGCDLPVQKLRRIAHEGKPYSFEVEIETTGEALTDLEMLLEDCRSGWLPSLDDADDRLVESLKHIINLLEQEKNS